MCIDAVALRRLWPRAPQGLVEAVAAKSAEAFARHGLTTRLRVAHFMAQISHESGGGTIIEESLNYTTPERIAAVWPRRFTVETAAAYTHNPKKLASSVYNGRMGNRADTEDGYTYRGRGLLQLTGRDNYREIGALCGLPLEQRPDLAYAPTATLEIAATEFARLGCLPWCDKDNLEAVTRRVNGGYTGLAQRKGWLARWKAALPEAKGTAEPAPSPEPFDKPEPPPELPRGSDEVLPPGVDAPAKDMAESKTGWAAVIATVTSIAATAGQALDSVRPLLEDPRIFLPILAVIAGAGIFIWFDRRRRLRADHV